MSFADQRRPYTRGVLSDELATRDPLELLAAFIAEAREDGDREPTAMALATVDPDGSPVVRTVLCKGVDARGVRFFTGTQSRKGRALALEPRAAVSFWWPSLERSARIVGVTTPLPREVVDAYFAGRPRGSRLGAWASEQSQPIAGRSELEAQAAASAAQFAGDEPTAAPPRWGGYELFAREVELWQGRDDRMHDRLRFTRSGVGTAPGPWTVERLQP